MTDEPAPIEGAPADPSRDRARIEPSTPAKKTDLLPILYLVGFVALAGALYFLWQNPPEARLAAQDASKVDTLQAQVTSLRDAVARLEQQKPAASGPSAAEFQQLQQQVAGLAKTPAASESELQPLQQQVQALAARPTVTPDQLALVTQQVQSLTKQEPDLKPVTQRLDALESRPAFDPSSLDGKFGQLASQVGQVGDKVQQLATRTDEAATGAGQSLKDLQGRVDALEQQQKAIAQRAQLATKLQGAATALAAGQKLGPLQGAPPALARFATEAPPTEASLRESFNKHAADAQAVSQPASADDQGFASRLWSRAQQSVTVRQGDHVLVGDPIAGVIAHAREQLDNGDLAGAVETLKGLAGPPAKAMQPWVEKATALLDARAAIATMVAG